MTEAEEFEFRRRREAESAVSAVTEKAPVMGLPEFQSTGGGAAVGNPTLKAKNPKPETDFPYEGGGLVTDALAKTGLPPEVSAAGGYVTNLAMQAAPVVFGGAGGAKAAPAVASVGESLMKSALKPTLAMWKKGEGQRAVDTMLQEGYNATKGGVEKMRGKVDDLENQISSIMQNHAGATIDKGAVGSRIQDVVQRIERTNPTPQDALLDVQRVYDQFLGNGLVPKNIPVEQAQELKRGIYKLLREKYGAVSSDATVEGRKALGRGFKEEINAVAPEAVPLHAAQGDLLNAIKVAGRRAMMDENKNPFGLAMLTHSPETFMAHMASGSAAVKSMLARLLHSNAGNITTGAGAAAGASLSDLQR